MSLSLAFWTLSPLKFHSHGVALPDGPPSRLSTRSAVSSARICRPSCRYGFAAPRPARSARTALRADAPDPTESNLGALWKEYRPDRFDVYAAGVVMMQMGVKRLRRKVNPISLNPRPSRRGW